MTKQPDIKESARKDVENRLHEIFPNTHIDSLDHVVQFAIDDVFETSALGEGEDYYADGDISLACQRALLHFLGHPDY